MAQEIYDTFDEATHPVTLASHTPNDGGSWTPGIAGAGDSWRPGGYLLNTYDTGDSVGSICQSTTGTNIAGYKHSFSPGVNDDFDVLIDIANYDDYASTSGARSFICWRCKDDTKSGYGFGYQMNDQLKLFRYDLGSSTTLLALGTRGTPTVEPTFHQFKIEVRGNQFTVFEWITGAWSQIGQTSDSTYAAETSVYVDALSGKTNIQTVQLDFAESDPVKPTIAIDDQGPDWIELSSSAFDDGVPQYGQAGSQWQVTLAADTGFASPIIDVTTTNPADFESFHASGGLNLFLNQYIARVRHQDSYPGTPRWSQWSDASSNTATETEGQYYTAFAERPVGVDIRTDIPADWSELDTSDGESTWFLNERDDATCLVTMDRVSLDGVAGTVDPILWEGFPSVGQQIVFGRFVFDTITAEGTCSGGIQSDNDYICRETYGLKQGPLYGAAGGADWTAGVKPGGGFDALLSCLPSIGAWCRPDPRTFTDVVTGILDTDWVQYACKHVFSPGTGYWDCPYVYGFIAEGGVGTGQAHYCGLFKTAGKINFGTGRTQTGATGRYSPGVALGTPPANYWIHNKLGPTLDGRAQRHVAWESHIGIEGEKRTADDGQFAGGALSFIVADPCCYSCDGLTSTHGDPSPCGIHIFPAGQMGALIDELIVCAGNRVRILDLPTGWQVEIGGTGPHVSTADTFWPQPITGDGSDDQYIDFDSFAWPADTMYLRDAQGNLIEEWDVPTGIWGGDEYRILSGILGAAGVGARLSGTFEGTDGTGYIAYIDANDGLKLDRWSAAGGLVNLDTVAFPVVTGVYYNVVLEAVGSTIRAKAWAGGAGLQGDPENNDPGTWAISEVDATYSAGAPGLVGLTSQPVDFDAFAAGLGGDPYPTGRYPGACSWVNPAAGSVFDTGDSPILLEWTPPPVTAGVLGGEIVYELQFQTAGESGWAPLASNVRETTYSWDLSSLPAGYYCVQVRAYAGCEYGPWTPVCFQWIGGVSKVPDGYFFGDWYTGETDVGMWIRLFQASHFDDGQLVPGCLVTRELMPAGAGGECLFQKLYVVVTASTQGTLKVTPILDGDYLLEEQRYMQLSEIDENEDPYDPAALPPSGARTRRYEIDLTEGYGNPEKFRHGYRGTYWQVEICATDHSGQGRIEIDGVYVTYTVVRETHAWARPFMGELEVDVDHEGLSRFFYGTTVDDGDGALYKAEEGNTDFGEQLTVLLEPNKYAPFGSGGEGWFRTLYLNTTRTNVSDMEIEVVPLLDQVGLEPVTISLPAVTQPVTEVHEIPLSVPHTQDGIEVGRAGARGVWFSYRVTNSSARASGEIIFNGAALEAIPVRETEPGVT